MTDADATVGAPLRPARLEDRYQPDRGFAYINGIQALVRVLLTQSARDRAAGLNTGGFVSGYRGSPLAGLDQTLWSLQDPLTANHIEFVPGVNEDLAATACWGTQQLMMHPEEATVDGVFAMWYGKGPGVDRSADALKHANAPGTSQHGGALVLVGDDHTAKSSSCAHQRIQDYEVTTTRQPVTSGLDPRLEIWTASGTATSPTSRSLRPENLVPGQGVR